MTVISEETTEETITDAVDAAPVDDAAVIKDVATDSFILKWIKVANFRRFAKAELTLPDSGLTGISGVNGSGKSSFLIAVMFCLFGQTPNGVTKDQLRYSKADPKTEQTEVSVGFQHAGQTVEVIRRISGTRNTVTADIYLDGTLVTMATGTTAASWVVNRLGMDAQGFQTAIVVPQEELTDLINALPSVRRARIEKLAGIEDMNEAVKNARADENALSKAVKDMPGSEEEVERLEKEAAAIDAELDELEIDWLDSKTAVDDLDVAISNIQQNLNRYRADLNTLNTMRSDLSGISNQIDLKKSEIKNVQSRLSELETEFADVDMSGKAELEEKYKSISADYDALSKKIAVHSNELRNAQRQLVDAQRHMTDLEDEKEAVAQEVASLSEAIKDFDLDEHAKTLEEKEEKYSTLLSQRASAKSSREELLGSIDSLSSVHGKHDKAECPTCHSELSDPSALIEQFKKTIQSLETLDKDISAQVSVIVGEIRSLKNDIEDTKIKKSRLGNAQEKFDALVVRIANGEATIKKLNDAYEELAGVDIEESNAEKERMDAERTDTSRALDAILRAEKAQKQQESLKSAISDAQGNLEALEASYNELSEKIYEFGDAGILNDSISSSEEALSIKQKDRQGMFSIFKDVETKQASATERSKFCAKALATQKKLVETKRIKLDLLVEKTATTGLLEEYRKDRISRIAPELSATATELIGRMTNDAFTDVIVKEDFSTSVIDSDGAEYNISVLSGGERSIVALALRIAIGSLITGENAGLLWLDEVLPAQDKERRDAILSVLRSLPIHQIVMINHTHDAEDVVDHTIKIVRDADGSKVV